MAIVMLVALMILDVIINIASFLIPFALVALIALFIIAVILRLVSSISNRR